jgi:hypothetical protein
MTKKSKKKSIKRNKLKQKGGVNSSDEELGEGVKEFKIQLDLYHRQIEELMDRAEHAEKRAENAENTLDGMQLPIEGHYYIIDDMDSQMFPGLIQIGSFNTRSKQVKIIYHKDYGYPVDGERTLDLSQFSSDYDNMKRIGLEKPDLITFKRLSDEMEGWPHVD